MICNVILLKIPYNILNTIPSAHVSASVLDCDYNQLSGGAYCNGYTTGHKEWAFGVVSEESRNTSYPLHSARVAEHRYMQALLSRSGMSA